jgi:hypothetical protein
MVKNKEEVRSMTGSEIMRNPLARGNAAFNNPAGNVLEEISMQEASDQVAGGYDSDALGNTGYFCSVTQECQHICNWTLWCW